MASSLNPTTSSSPLESSLESSEVPEVSSSSSAAASFSSSSISSASSASTDLQKTSSEKKAERQYIRKAISELVRIRKEDGSKDTADIANEWNIDIDELESEMKRMKIPLDEPVLEYWDP